MSAVCAVLVRGSDIYGWRYNNTRAWADRLAQQGFLVLLPDFFNGTAWSAARSARGDSIGAWLAQFPTPRVLNQTASLIAAVRKAKLGPFTVGKIGAKGFCWGGKYSLLLTNGKSPTAAAGVVYHGSLIEQSDVSGVNAPINFQQSDPKLDAIFGPELYAFTEKTLAEKRKAGLDAQITSCPGQPHGFALRGNARDPVAVKAADATLNAGAAFLANHLA